MYHHHTQGQAFHFCLKTLIGRVHSSVLPHGPVHALVFCLNSVLLSLTHILMPMSHLKVKTYGHGGAKIKEVVDYAPPVFTLGDSNRAGYVDLPKYLAPFPGHHLAGVAPSASLSDACLSPFLYTLHCSFSAPHIPPPPLPVFYMAISFSVHPVRDIHSDTFATISAH